MDATETIGEGLTFEKVWAALMENRELQKETDRLIKETAEQMKETAEQMKETDKRMKEIDKQIQKTEKLIEKNAREIEALKQTIEWVPANVGGLNRPSLRELIEALIAARLWEQFPDYNLKRAYPQVPIFDENICTLTDIDILLSNTDTAMAVEVKRELNDRRDVDDHLRRMERIRQYPPAEVGGKKMLGAMAGGVVDDDTRQYAYECGFFVLELTGDTVQLIPPPDGFVPRQW
jgi:hypothetical protein